MPPKPGYVVILTACSSRDEAELMAQGLVEERLAACVQVAPVTSFFTWRAKPTQAEEWILAIKAPRAQYENIEAYIVERHSYELPEVVQLPIEQGLPAYLNWIDEAVL